MKTPELMEEASLPTWLLEMETIIELAWEVIRVEAAALAQADG